MKAEERHELQQNDLQSWLQYGLWIWLKNNGSYIILVLALLLLGYNLWNWYERNQLEKAQKAWQELAATDVPGVENKAVKLQAIIDTYDSRPIRALALRALGNMYLDNVAAGVTVGDTPTATVTVDKQDALNRAQSAFERILTEYPEQTLAVGAAKIGLAVVAENRREWDSARKQYEAIADKSSPFAGSAFAADATRRLALLDKLKAAPRLDTLAPATSPASRPAIGRTMGPMPIEPTTSAPAATRSAPLATTAPAPASSQPK